MDLKQINAYTDEEQSLPTIQIILMTIYTDSRTRLVNGGQKYHKSVYIPSSQLCQT